ncbi:MULTISPECIES: molybdate ABC transporter substrate-binding protein [unclassified Lentimonas]|uniref:molybdate ABC transporter substrate-binding protein n=1 Tax=unclassified Lentimonas TaxID=2630993 RepID=UPI001321983E|nr:MULTISPECIES: molybdate ABC transporter substrate-binding protein [unclassified Lentimonas]CAA6694993.1 Molybdenum ABC transporter, periplasmic molybdenum-binding protein ModA (TC 3.A.1.8.1) [Lentimonas sp. CC19]CAA6695357.1 Molybdenum ABC transporter, periplasmic molybdenum-binding protein ModA (TC 3.A.1.8.1) [Lentimonas sp. CC10]CAA7072024.1 Molybdenum ABC transporter, periplasmic molybdenum-binding protein ModA (TC 3.A.1.8.1) [Lentimonas sp. CC11]
MRLFIILSIGLIACLYGSGCGPQERVRVFAAASTAAAVETIAAQFYEETGIAVAVNAASSSTLARQIESGAPADVFLSANVKWMEYLQADDRLVPGTTVHLLGNQLVVVSADGDLQWAHGDGEVLGDYRGMVALGDPDHVPVGMYVKSALVQSGEWDAVAPRVIAGNNASSAVNFVATGEVAVGVVYATDAQLSKRVQVLYPVPEALQPDIIYPVALVRGAGESAQMFYEYLQSAAAGAVFEGSGFLIEGRRARD